MNIGSIPTPVIPTAQPVRPQQAQQPAPQANPVPAATDADGDSDGSGGGINILA